MRLEQCVTKTVVNFLLFKDSPLNKSIFETHFTPLDDGPSDGDGKVVSFWNLACNWTVFNMLLLLYLIVFLCWISPIFSLVCIGNTYMWCASSLYGVNDMIVKVVNQTFQFQTDSFKILKKEKKWIRKYFFSGLMEF